MDNSIIGVSRLLLASLEGEPLPPDDQQRLLDYFSAFATASQAPPGSAELEQLLDQYREADRVQGFSRRWRQKLASADLDTQLATAFIKAFIQELSQSHWRTAHDGLTCGTTVTAAHSVMDYPTVHHTDGRQWVLHWTTEGAYLLGGELQQLVVAGELLLIPPQCQCEYRRSPASERWSHHWVRFYPDPDWVNWCPPLHSGSKPFSSTVSDQLHSSISSAFSDLRSLQGQANSRLTRNRLEFLLLILAGGDGASQALLDPRIQNAVAFIGANYTAAWCMSDLADHCHISVPRLASLFRQQLGVAPMQWRDQLRMQDACRQLRDSRKQVADISRAVGYDDPQHFSRRFRQLVGGSPRHYRQSR